MTLLSFSGRFAKLFLLSSAYAGIAEMARLTKALAGDWKTVEMSSTASLSLKAQDVVKTVHVTLVGGGTALVHSVAAV